MNLDIVEDRGARAGHALVEAGPIVDDGGPAFVARHEGDRRNSVLVVGYHRHPMGEQSANRIEARGVIVRRPAAAFR